MTMSTAVLVAMAMMAVVMHTYMNGDGAASPSVPPLPLPHQRPRPSHTTATASFSLYAAGVRDHPLGVHVRRIVGVLHRVRGLVQVRDQSRRASGRASERPQPSSPRRHPAGWPHDRVNLPLPPSCLASLSCVCVCVRLPQRKRAYSVPEQWQHVQRRGGRWVHIVHLHM